MRLHKGLALRLALMALPLTWLTACSEPATTTASEAAVKQLGSFQPTEHGVLIQLPQQHTQLLRLEVMSERIIRVTALPHNQLSAVGKSLVVTAQPQGQFTVEQQGEQLLLKTSQLTAVASLLDGAVHFIDKKGQITLAETKREFGPVTQDPVQAAADSYALQQQWNKNTDEGFLGWANTRMVRSTTRASMLNSPLITW